jgi:hypothetical protein
MIGLELMMMKMVADRLNRLNGQVRLVPSETQCLLENISLGRTDALSAHRLFWTVLSLSQPFNAGYRVEYPFFARFLALCQARGITIPTIGLGSLHSIAPKPIAGIVIIRARHSAKIRAKSLIVSEKNYCNHHAPMQ